MTNCSRGNGRQGGLKNRGRLKGWQRHTTARRAVVAAFMARGCGLSAIARGNRHTPRDPSKRSACHPPPAGHQSMKDDTVISSASCAAFCRSASSGKGHMGHGSGAQRRLGLFAALQPRFAATAPPWRRARATGARRSAVRIAVGAMELRQHPDRDGPLDQRRLPARHQHYISHRSDEPFISTWNPPEKIGKSRQTQQPQNRRLLPRAAPPPALRRAFSDGPVLPISLFSGPTSNSGSGNVSPRPPVDFFANRAPTAPSVSTSWRDCW
jgi:hypothetical protein